MSVIFFVPLALALSSPSPDEQDAAQLVERLASPSIQDREAAACELRRLGTLAVPELRKAGNHLDPEVAARAEHLLRVLSLSERLTPGLLETFPGVEERLVLGFPQDWTELFLEATEVIEGKPKYPSLGRPDCDALSSMAIRGARGEGETRLVSFRIGERRLGGAARELIHLLEDENEHVRNAASWALRHLDSRTALKEILPLLEEKDKDIRWAAAYALRRARARELVPDVISLLAHKDADVRMVAAWLLGRLGDRRASPHVAKLLADEKEGVRETAAIALKRLGGSEAVPTILRLLDEVPRHRRQMLYGLDTLYALDTLDFEQAIPHIAKLLVVGDPNPERAAAVVLFGRNGRREQAPRIARLLGEWEDYRLLWRVADALGSLGAREYARDLVPLLSHPEEWVRYQAVGALGKIGTKEQAIEIVPLLHDPKDMVRNPAIRALGKIGTERELPNIRPLLKDRNEHIRASAVAALGDLGARSQIDTVRSFLDVRHWNIRSEAIPALAKLGDTESIPRIIERLRSTDWHENHAANEALEIFGLETMESYLRANLESYDRQVRLTAARALCRLGSRAGVETILDDRGAFDSLNALRNRKLWMRLGETEVPDNVWGVMLDGLDCMAMMCGLSLEHPCEPRDLDWLLRRQHIAQENGTLLDVLSGLLPQHHTFILDSDVLRIVSREDAQTFWNAWWQREQGRN